MLTCRINNNKWGISIKCSRWCLSSINTIRTWILLCNLKTWEPRWKWWICKTFNSLIRWCKETNKCRFPIIMRWIILLCKCNRWSNHKSYKDKFKFLCNNNSFKVNNRKVNLHNSRDLMEVIDDICLINLKN